MCSTTLPLGQSWPLLWHRHLSSYMPGSRSWAGLTVRRMITSSEMQSRMSQGFYRYDMCIRWNRKKWSDICLLRYWSANGIVWYIFFRIFLILNVLVLHVYMSAQTLLHSFYCLHTVPVWNIIIHLTLLGELVSISRLVDKYFGEYSLCVCVCMCVCICVCLYFEPTVFIVWIPSLWIFQGEDLCILGLHGYFQITLKKSYSLQQLICLFPCTSPLWAQLS